MRLHVVANSDSAVDQACKLQVRDAVLSCIGKLSSPEEINENVVKRAERAANAALKKLGMPYTAKAELLWEDYPTKTYDTFSLPAGLWKSLRITIGAGVGHNWWCVVFPALCSAGTPEAWKEAAQKGNLSQSELRMIVGGEQKYVLQFRLLEWLQALKRCMK